MKASRAEYTRAANQMRKKLMGEMRANKSMIDQEIDTDEEWGACRHDSWGFTEDTAQSCPR